MKIGELAKQAAVSVQTIRFYERRRLMRTPRRTSAGYRVYNESDVEIVRAIKQMQHFGFTLREVRSILQLFAVPSDTGKEPTHTRGSHACLREAIGLGELKLKAMNKQIQALIAVRDELEGTLQQFRAKLAIASKPVSSQAVAAGSGGRRHA